MSDIEYEKPLAVHETGIRGLKLLDLPVHGDARGWFKENWQRAKMCELGIPDLRFVQNNVSFNVDAGVTRGIHAEPWDKFVSIAAGSAFGAWLDLRSGSATFGRCFTCVLDPTMAIYVPRGVGNAFQALEDGTVYTYLVNSHWSAELKKTYTFVNLADPELDIEWPIPLESATVSDADKAHPLLADVRPMPPRRTLVTGANGQLGRAVRALAGRWDLTAYFDFANRDAFDISNAAAYAAIDWSQYGTVINCGAYTAVDAAETTEGRIACWAANATGPAMLARVCAEHDITLVHVSSDYVFDGTRRIHLEDEHYSPLGVYGQSKAAGDLAVAGCRRHFIVRSSWVVGEGHNFVKTMAALSDRCASEDDALQQVRAVNDQMGRLTFTDDLAKGIFWLLGYREGDVEPSASCEYGVYNLTGSGRIASWADIAARVFELRNGNANAVVPVSTADYYADAAAPASAADRCADAVAPASAADHNVDAKVPIAPRPTHSALDLSKIEATGFTPRDWEEELEEYLCVSQSPIS
jgi:dTDP-4-dehydrorhamnose 3,5-epimerase/reductase